MINTVLTRYDKNNIIGCAKDTQKQVFGKRLKIKQNISKVGADFFMNFDSRLGRVNFFQSEKTSVKVSAVPKLTVSL